MSRDLANLIDALIPGTIGLLIIVFPNLFVKKDAEPEKRTAV